MVPVNFPLMLNQRRTSAGRVNILSFTLPVSVTTTMHSPAGIRALSPFHNLFDSFESVYESAINKELKESDIAGSSISN